MNRCALTALVAFFTFLTLGGLLTAFLRAAL